MNITVEIRQMIFQLRAEMTNVKMNRKGMYENLECQVCNEENESQNHILECKILNKNEKNNIDYTKIKNGNIIQMVQIARKYKENLNIRDKI